MNKILAYPLIGLLAASAFGQETAPGVGSTRPAANAPAAQATTLPGKTAVTSFEGFVEVVGGNGRPQRLSSAPRELQDGDEVRTFREGRAVIVFKDGSRVSLDPNSVFMLQQESPSALTLFLKLGKLWASVAKGPHRDVQVRTLAAVAAVRGTSFSVEALSHSMVTEVFEGAVAVEALKSGALTRHEVLLLPGQRVEASNGALSDVRNVARPPASRPAAEPPKKKAELRKELKTMLAQPEIKRDADKSSAIAAALKSGEEEKMRGVAESLRNAPTLPTTQQETLLKAFGERKSLAQIVLLETEAAKPMDAHRQVKQQMAAWSVNREIGLQLGEQTHHAMLAKGAVSAAASQASVGATMASYQQQYTQSYLGAQQAAQTALQPAGAVGAAPAASLPASGLSGAAPAAPPTATVSQMPGAATQTLAQPAVSPTSPSYNAAPPPLTAPQTTINIVAPPPGNTCSCTGTTCACTN